MIGRRSLFAGGTIAAAILVGGLLLARRDVATPPRLVILYAPCTVNREYLAPYSPEVSYTPHLTRFAQQGITFTNHHTEEGLSGIGYASLLSGTQAMSHGVYSHPTRLNDRSYVITEAYRDRGYDVFFWNDHDMIAPNLNYGQGVATEQMFWEARRVRARTKQSGAFLRADDAAFHQVLTRLKRDPNYKAFLLTTFTVTHIPYNGLYIDKFCREYPAECTGLSDAVIRESANLFRAHGVGFQIAFDATVAKLRLQPAEVTNLIRVVELLYKSNIHHLDSLFGEVVQEIDTAALRADTLIAFTADHGELMYRANAPYHWLHGYTLGAEDILVPLIVRGRGLNPGRYEGVTRSVDVFPTLAGLSGFSLPDGAVMGADLSAALLGKAPAPQLTAFCHTGLFPAGYALLLPGLAARLRGGYDPAGMWVAARRGELMYKLADPDGSGISPHVYNWATDPAEVHDLYNEHDESHRAMIGQLVEYKKALQDGYETLRKGPAPSLSEAQKEALRALGYIQ